MKKIIVVLFMISIVLSLTFAETLSDSFNINTAVDSINEIKMTQGTPTAGVSLSGMASPESFTNGSLIITSDNYKSNISIGNLSVRSNNRAGYKVNVKATAMKHSDANIYINYTITFGTGGSAPTLTTNNGTQAARNSTFDQGVMTTMAAQHVALSVKVNEADYEAAVSGSYSGTVILEFVAN